MDNGSTLVKKALVWLVALFAVFYLFTHPVNMGHTVADIWGAIVDGVRQVIRFFTALGGDHDKNPPQRERRQRNPNHTVRPALSYFLSSVGDRLRH